MYFIKCFLVLLVISDIYSIEIHERIIQYFKSETVHRFKYLWRVHKKPMENAIGLTLKENFGTGAMNIYMKETEDPRKLSKGYFHDDNQVRLFLGNLVLQNPLSFWFPNVQLALESNLIRLDSNLNRIVIDADYISIRNKSDIVFADMAQDQSKTSPFLYQQVEIKGKVAIVAEGCFLSGYAIATLNGQSVNIGYHKFRFLRCQYTFEIYQSRGIPPVIVKYDPNGDKGITLEHLLLKPLFADLMPKLHAALFSFVNTSAHLGDQLTAIQREQKHIFQAVSQFMTAVVRNLNRIAIESYGGTLDLNPLHFTWDDRLNQLETENDLNEFMISNLVLTGLDTAYSAHTGGPMKFNTYVIGEQIRFHSVQVRGLVTQATTKDAKTMPFGIEMNDVAANIELDINRVIGIKKSKKSVSIRNVEVINIRTMDLSMSDMLLSLTNTVLSGYIQNIVSERLQAYLTNALEYAISMTMSGPGTEKNLPTKIIKKDALTDCRNKLAAYQSKGAVVSLQNTKISEHGRLDEDNNKSDHSNPSDENNPSDLSNPKDDNTADDDNSLSVGDSLQPRNLVGQISLKKIDKIINKETGIM